MLGLLSQPKTQSAEDAIVTLCDRLSNSLLIEDRRVAVLALRGLSHENREFVASVGLKGLLAVLVKDYFDPELAKATLETLLNLFNTNTRGRVHSKRYVSALLRDKTANSSEEQATDITSDISLWLTDQLLHNDKALQCILKLAVTKNDPFTAVCALQLVSVMIVNRTVETKQAILTSGGVASLVTALGSAQDMVRDEALLLLSALTSDHLELQKLVAFEGGFDRAFAILVESGGIIYGGRFTEDCLILVANLIECNASNQKLFTNSGNVGQWASLLQSVVDALNEGTKFREQTIANVEAALVICQLLCLPNAELTLENQNIVNAHNVLTTILQIAFGPSSPPQVRVSALVTSAAIVQGNIPLQTSMLNTDVPYYDLGSLSTHTTEPKLVSMSQALLNWCVSISSAHMFDVRCASLVCLRCCFHNNLEAKIEFLKEQIENYGKQLDIEMVNLIEVLADYSDDTRLNPFRIWFASAVTMHLLENADECKSLLCSVIIGDESLGMESQSLIQAIAGEMQGALQQSDPTVALGYVQLLSVWLYDDIDAVNEFTVETSTVQSLLAHQSPDPLVKSLGVVLLGIAYAFCKKDAKFSRKSFHNLLTQNLGRDQYLMHLRKLRQSSLFMHFDESEMFRATKSENGFPAVYLEVSYVDLMKECLPHISKAIDLDPDVEPASKVTFEMVSEIQTALHKSQVTLEKTSAKLEEATKLRDEFESKLQETLKRVNKSDTASKENIEKIAKLENEVKLLNENAESLQTKVSNLSSSLKTEKLSSEALKSDQAKLMSEFTSTKAAKEKAENGVNNMTREIFQLQRKNETLERENSKNQSDLSKLKPKLELHIKSESELKKHVADLKSKLDDQTQKFNKVKETNEKLVSALKETAGILKKREEEEKTLQSDLSKTKLELESNDNELRSLKNREAITRKQLDKANSKLEECKLAANQSNSNKNEIDGLKSENSNLKMQTVSLSEKLQVSDGKFSEIEKNFEVQNSQLQKVKEDFETSEKALKEMKSNNEKLKDVNVKLLKDLSIAKKETIDDKNTTDEKDTASEIKRFKNELQEKQNELDELMGLLEHFSEKTSAYKARLRKYKEEVLSDSEGEDEEL